MISVAWSLDGGMIFSGSSDHSVKIWDTNIFPVGLEVTDGVTVFIDVDYTFLLYGYFTGMSTAVWPRAQVTRMTLTDPICSCFSDTTNFFWQTTGLYLNINVPVPGVYSIALFANLVLVELDGALEVTCPSGMHITDLHMTTAGCEQCAPGTFTNDDTNKLICTACTVGTFQSDPGHDCNL